MLRGAAAAIGEEGTGWFYSVGGGREDLEKFGPRKGLVPFRQNRPHLLPGGGERNEDNLALMPGHALATVGDLGDGKFDRPGAGRGRTFQYQLSLRSAGGIGSTCPVSWAGIFIDFVGMKNVPISMAPTPVSMTTRETP